MGTRLRLSNGRRLVDDVIAMANQTPLAALSTTFDLQKLARLRRMAQPRISWNVLFMKAYAQVCADNPQLRQTYVTMPWPHLYEHHQNVCMMTMAREHAGEERLLFARFNEPDRRPLPELETQYAKYRKDPVDSIKQFRHQIMFARCPAAVRRFAWWSLFNLWPQKRASHMGTFGISFSGHRGTQGAMHLGPNTTTIGVDPLPRNGQSFFLYTFDHRVIDGSPATEFMQQTMRKLNTTISQELAAMAGVDAESLKPADDDKTIAA